MKKIIHLTIWFCHRNRERNDLYELSAKSRANARDFFCLIPIPSPSKNGEGRLLSLLFQVYC